MRLSRGSKRWLAVGTVAILALMLLNAENLGVSVPVSTESNSMSHSDGPLRDVLDPGEPVMMAPVHARSDVLTYFEGRDAAYRVASDWGDVISFHPLPTRVQMLVLHRAIVWVAYNATADAYDVPELGLAAVRQFIVPEAGSWDPWIERYTHAPMEVHLDPNINGRHDGFLTKGDHNNGFDQDIRGELVGLGVVPLVPVERITGKVTRIIEADDTRLVFAFTGAITIAVAIAWRTRHRLRRALRPAVAMCESCGQRRSEGEAFCLRCGRAHGERS